jgi:hypothetical protein
MLAEGKATPRREETTPVSLTWTLLGRKMKKTYTIDSTVTNGQWRFKVTVNYYFKKYIQVISSFIHLIM